MKKIIIALSILAFVSCTDSSSSESDTTVPDLPSSSTPDTSCGVYNGHQLYKGPSGGCYYINTNGNKTYIDHSFCHC